MSEKEFWRDVKGYEGLYQVSNLGRVKSVAKATNNQYSNKETTLKAIKHNTGYLVVGLYNEEHKCKIFSIHRLVAEHFINNPNNLLQVNHIDGNKENNCIDNLEWCSCSYNIKHAYDNGIKPKKYGAKHHNAKRVNQYDLQGNFIKTWECIKDAERELKIKATQITQVCKHSERYKTCGGYKWQYAKE